MTHHPLSNTLKERIKVHKSAYEQPYQHWQSLAEFTRYTFFLPPPPAMKFFQSNAFQNFWSEVYVMYAESVGNGKAYYRQEIISWWGLSLSFLRNTLIIKYNILETGHENYQQPIFANHVKLLDCCRIQIDKWVYWSHWMNGFTLTMISQFESFATQLRVFWTRK